LVIGRALETNHPLSGLSVALLSMGRDDSTRNI
jgi:hypothetical protein